MTRLGLGLAILFACGLAAADPTVTLRGTLVDRATRQPVAGAVIELGGELAASNDDGTFVITLAPGDYTLVVTAPWLVTRREPITLTHDTALTFQVDAAATPPGEQILRSLIPTASVSSMIWDARAVNTDSGFTPRASRAAGPRSRSAGC